MAFSLNWLSKWACEPNYMSCKSPTFLETNKPPLDEGQIQVLATVKSEGTLVSPHLKMLFAMMFEAAT